MRLFKDHTRTFTGPARESEGLFVWLGRSARPVAASGRALLEQWFSEYPQHCQAELRSRFKDRRGMDGPFFELYTHALLIRLGYSVEVHPAGDGSVGRSPDFLVSSLGEPQFYVEASVVTEASDSEVAAETRMSVLFEALNRVASPDFFLDLEIRGKPKTPAPGAKIRRELEAWLASLDYEGLRALYAQGGRDAMPSRTYKHDGLVLRVSPFPKSDRLRGAPGVRPVAVWNLGASRCVSDKAIRVKVGEKAGQLPELGTPYVLFLNALQLHADREDVLLALFGTPDSRAVSRTGVARPDAQGAWFFAGEPQNTRVSGVFFAMALRLWTVASAEVRFYPNPWASAPYCGRLCSFPRASVDHELEYVQGTHSKHVLGLDEDWYDTGTAA